MFMPVMSTEPDPKMKKMESSYLTWALVMISVIISCHLEWVDDALNEDYVSHVGKAICVNGIELMGAVV
jgi:hypothetical protein